jgi:cobalamin biosynthesis protein CobW
MSGSGRIPATIITGFLGAGKTALIRHLLGSSDRRLALVINEFGDLGVDGEVVRGCGLSECPEDDVVELANGCICCTVADDFLPTMRTLVARTPRPDHIVIETSGLALPKPLIKAFTWPEIRTQVTVDGVIAVADAPAVYDGRFAADADAVQAAREADPALDHDSPLAEVYTDQLGAADLVVLNKTDLLDAGALAETERTVRGELRPGQEVVRARQGAVEPAVILGQAAAAEADLETRPSHHDDADDDHDHDEFESFALDLPEPASATALVRALTPVVEMPGVLRVKGFASVTGKPMRLVVQAVGPRIHHHFDRELTAAEGRGARLVIIGRAGLDRAAVAERLGAAAAV